MARSDWEFVGLGDEAAPLDVFGTNDSFGIEGAAGLGMAEGDLLALDPGAGMTVRAARAPGDDAPFFSPGEFSSSGLETFVAEPGGLPNVAAPVADGEALGAGELIFIDGGAFAKGGIPGPNGGGGGGGGGSGDPNVLDEYTSGADGAYNIHIDFKGSWTSDLQTAFIDAADRLSATITGDIADVFFRGKIIDDITIKAELKAIDGEGGILGQAGPTAIRTDGYLPAAATMQFDEADAATFNGLGLWDEIVTHEMLHSVGFGTVWDYLGLLDTSDANNPLFTGAGATTEYDPTAAGVPVEQDGGPGTALGHWDEETFGDELMTGWLNATTTSDLSAMTVASLEDLGYDTVWTDPFA